MIRSQIRSQTDRKVLSFLHRFAGKSVDIDSEVVRPLGFSHDLLCRTLRHLRSAGYIGYHHVYASGGRSIYAILWVSDIKSGSDPDDQLLLNFGENP